MTPPLRRLKLPRVALAAGVFFLHGLASAMPSHLIFFGTYTRNGSQGIYAAHLDATTGALSAPTLAAETTNPPWIVLSPDKKFLYTTSETSAQAVGFTVDAANAKLTPLSATASPAARAPSHLAIDATGQTLLAANYGDGYVESLSIHPDGTLGTPLEIKLSGTSVHPVRQTQPHTHSVTLSPDNRFVIVCDLGLDKIFTYALDPATAKLTPASPPYVTTAPGAGPRHFKFGADGRHAYAVNEINNTVAAYDYEAKRGMLTARQTLPTLPANFTGENTAAEIRVHPNGRFLYTSNRGDDSLAVFAIDPVNGMLSPLEIVPSGGKTPRNFALSPDGAWLVCAHQDSNNVTVFRVDPATGRLTRTYHTVTVPASVCVLFYD